MDGLENGWRVTLQPIAGQVWPTGREFSITVVFSNVYDQAVLWLITSDLKNRIT